MTKKQIEDLANATMMSVGIIQGAYMQFLQKNSGDKETALLLTKITWDGIMQSGGRTNNEDDNKLL